MVPAASRRNQPIATLRPDKVAVVLSPVRAGRPASRTRFVFRGGFIEGQRDRALAQRAAVLAVVLRPRACHVDRRLLDLTFLRLVLISVVASCVHAHSRGAVAYLHLAEEILRQLDTTAVRSQAPSTPTPVAPAAPRQVPTGGVDE